MPKAEGRITNLRKFFISAFGIQALISTILSQPHNLVKGLSFKMGGKKQASKSPEFKHLKSTFYQFFAKVLNFYFGKKIAAD
jgi:hypothetical protein